jgi:hypothetical protein
MQTIALVAMLYATSAWDRLNCGSSGRERAPSDRISIVTTTAGSKYAKVTETHISAPAHC